MRRSTKTRHLKYMPRILGSPSSNKLSLEIKFSVKVKPLRVKMEERRKGAKVSSVTVPSKLNGDATSHHPRSRVDTHHQKHKASYARSPEYSTDLLTSEQLRRTIMPQKRKANEGDLNLPLSGTQRKKQRLDAARTIHVQFTTPATSSGGKAEGSKSKSSTCTCVSYTSHLSYSHHKDSFTKHHRR